MPKETMTARGRRLAVLTGEKPYRIPMGYRGSPEAAAKLPPNRASILRELNLKGELSGGFICRFPLGKGFGNGT